METQEQTEAYREFIELYTSLPWYHRWHLRLLLAWKTHTCPVRINHPALRISVVYIACMLYLTSVIESAHWVKSAVHIGASLSIALIVNQIVGIYGDIRRLAHHPRRTSGD